jgi:hypothetical protein
MRKSGNICTQGKGAQISNSIHRCEETWNILNQITPLAILRDLECLYACCVYRAESYVAHPILQLHMDLLYYSSSLPCCEHLYIPSFRLYTASSLTFPIASVSIRFVHVHALQPPCTLFSRSWRCRCVRGSCAFWGLYFVVICTDRP